MRDKPDQLSGFKGSLAASTIYERFTEALRENAPETYIKAVKALETDPTSLRSESIWDKVTSTSTEETAIDGGEAGAGFSFGFEFEEGEDGEEELDDASDT